MIHKVKYGYMEVVLESSLTTKRAPDLTFKGARDKVFAVFFATFGTVEASAMLRAYYDYRAPFEAEYTDGEVKEILWKEAARNDEPL